MSPMLTPNMAILSIARIAQAGSKEEIELCMILGMKRLHTNALLNLSLIKLMMGMTVLLKIIAGLYCGVLHGLIHNTEK